MRWKAGTSWFFAKFDIDFLERYINKSLITICHVACVTLKIKKQIIISCAKQKAKIDRVADTIPHFDLQFPTKGGPAGQPPTQA